MCSRWYCHWISNHQLLLVPQTSLHPIKLSSIAVSWYGKFHVKVCVIINIWCEVIVGLYHDKIIDYVVKLIMEVCVVLQVIQPVL